MSMIEIPDEVQERSKLGVKKAKIEMEGPVKSFFRNRLVICILAFSILIPTGGFAYQAFLADDLYGSFDNVRKHISTATMEGYMLLNAKLIQAKGELGHEEYAEFKELLNVISTAKLDYGDKYGNIDYRFVPDEKFTEIRNTLFAIQPYFDRLNDLPSSREVLTALEYEEYINSLMRYEEILAQSGVNYDDIDRILEHLKEEMATVQAYLQYVNDKQVHQ